MASINLSWTASNPAPINGYRIKYWRTTNPGTVFTVTPNVTGTSYTITGLQDQSNYTGTIEASCAGGTYSTPANWSVTAIIPSYYYFATKFNCPGCTQVGNAGAQVLVSSTVLTVGSFYKLGDFSYRIDSAEPFTNGALDITAYSQTATTCAALCPASGGAGDGLTTAINGSTTATCSGGSYGTITIRTGEDKRVRIGTTFTSGSGTQSGATLSVTNSISGAPVLSISSSATSLYTTFYNTSTVILGAGTYNYQLSTVPCFNGSGVSTISLVAP